MCGEIGAIAGRKTLGRSERHDKRIFPRGGASLGSVFATKSGRCGVARGSRWRASCYSASLDGRCPAVVGNEVRADRVKLVDHYPHLAALRLSLRRVRVALAQMPGAALCRQPCSRRSATCWPRPPVAVAKVLSALAMALLFVHFHFRECSNILGCPNLRLVGARNGRQRQADKSRKECR